MSPHLHPARAAAVALALATAAPAAAAPWRLRHPAAARAAAAPAAAVYGGHTTQDDPFALRVARGGRALRSLLVRIDMACDDGKTASWPGAATFAATAPTSPPQGRNVFGPARIARDGRFQADGLGSGSYGPGVVGTLHETVKGRLRRGSGRGAFSATLDIVDQARGNPVTTCRSGALRWTARSAPGRVYAGLTGQEEPVVVERSRNGRRVDRLWISYSAPCQSGGAFTFGDPLVRFPVRRGSFGDTWSERYDRPEGAERVFEYLLTGTVGARKATGAFRLRVTDTDAAGAQKDVCDTGSFAWAADSTS